MVGLSAVALLAVAGSVIYQWLAWRSLTDAEKTEQRSIRRADMAVFRAERTQKGRVKAADRKINNAGLSPQRAKYGALALYDDHVRVNGREYLLTRGTKAKVVGHGRGDKREVMVLLEDTSWSGSVSATRVGKPNELSAQQFASETRVRAANADAARASRQHAISSAQAAASATRADTSNVDTARNARSQFGARHWAAGSPPPLGFWRPGTLLIGVLLLVLGLSATKATVESPTTTLAGQPPRPTTATSPTTPPAQSRTELRSDARSLVAVGAYARALSATTGLPRDDRSYVRRLISTRAARIATRALARGDRSAANRALLSARSVGAPRTAGLLSATRAYSVAIARVAQARKDRAAAKRRQEAEDAKETAQPQTPSSSGSSYAGLTCSEIGHSFTVEPGSDPDHDEDNDGEACESY